MHRRAYLSIGACLVLGPLLAGCTGNGAGSGASTDANADGDAQSAGGADAGGSSDSAESETEAAEQAIAGAVAEVESEPGQLDSLADAEDAQFETVELRRRFVLWRSATRRWCPGWWRSSQPSTPTGRSGGRRRRRGSTRHTGASTPQ